MNLLLCEFSCDIILPLAEDESEKPSGARVIGNIIPSAENGSTKPSGAKAFTGIIPSVEDGSMKPSGVKAIHDIILLAGDEAAKLSGAKVFGNITSSVKDESEKPSGAGVIGGDAKINSHEQQNHEEALVAAIKGGSQTAFAQFVDLYKQRLFSIVYNIVHNPSDTSDIIQDVFVKVYHSIHTFQSKASLFTWLYRIAINMSLSFLRKQKRNRFVSIDQLDESGITPEALRLIPVRDGGDQSTALKELQKNLNEALQKLSNDHRAVVVLFEIEGLSHGQIAQVLGCSEGTVRSRLHYAKQKLQGYLKEYL